ncbi:MAG: hypothetical protein M3N82_00180 [Pseudomonadota bacterium]|nr:hypothetical protein [Pseudomonadota bacterium]
MKTKASDVSAAPLPPGEWFVEQQAQVLKVFRDAAGEEHLADVAGADFLDGLATRQIVFVPWGRGTSAAGRAGRSGWGNSRQRTHRRAAPPAW